MNTFLSRVVPSDGPRGGHPRLRRAEIDGESNCDDVGNRRP